MINISIVEDNKLFRNTLADFLNFQSCFYLKSVYENAQNAIEGLIINKVDIAIVDIQMPKITGIELIKRLKHLLPNTQFLICTIHDDNENIFNALRAGASGYILKDSEPKVILDAIIDLYNGGSPMSPFIARKVINQYQINNKPNEDYNLTSREFEVLNQLAKGFLYKEIAACLNINIFTVKNHIKNIYKKLHVQNKVEALNKFNLI